jgi:hypothetical protein
MPFLGGKLIDQVLHEVTSIEPTMDLGIAAPAIITTDELFESYEDDWREVAAANEAFVLTEELASGTASAVNLAILMLRDTEIDGSTTMQDDDWIVTCPADCYFFNRNATLAKAVIEATATPGAVTMIVQRADYHEPDYTAVCGDPSGQVTAIGHSACNFWHTGFYVAQVKTFYDEIVRQVRYSGWEDVTPSVDNGVKLFFDRGGTCLYQEVTGWTDLGRPGRFHLANAMGEEIGVRSRDAATKELKLQAFELLYEKTMNKMNYIIEQNIRHRTSDAEEIERLLGKKDD